LLPARGSASTVADFHSAGNSLLYDITSGKIARTPFRFFSWNQDCDTVESGDKSQMSSDFRSYTVLPRCRMRELEMQTTEQTEHGIARTDVASEAPEYPRVEQDAGSRLANIFINCPITGVPVTTGLTTNWVVFHSLPSVAIPLRCRACGQMHRWKPRDAWIGHAAQSSDLTSIGAS
jgi:hypothetical protein